MSQFPDDLEAQLRRAAQRVHAGAEPAPRPPRRSGRLRRVLRAAPVLAAVGVTVALAVAVLVLVGHGRRSVSAPPSGLADRIVWRSAQGRVVRTMAGPAHRRAAALFCWHHPRACGPSSAASSSSSSASATTPRSTGP